MANTVEIVIRQTGSGNAIADANKALGGLSGVAGSATGILGSFGSVLGNVGTIAAGIVAANVFEAIVGGISSFVTVGIDAVGSSQQLETSLKALLTSNLMYETSIETVTQAVTKQVMSEEELGFKHDELTAKLATQQATYQEQEEKIRQLTLAYGENGLNVIKARAQHDELALSIQETQRDIDGLTTSETKYSTSTRQVYNQVLDQATAFEQASKQTEELLDFVSKLAVVSPFETEDVEQTTKYAIAAGMGVDETERFVPAFLDLAGAVGITSSELGFAADQLFQVSKVGKLTEIDLRQLRRVGIDLAKVIGVEMGMSVEEFNAEAEKSPEIFDELFAAVARFSENTFAGTAEEMATSVKGLQSQLTDLFVIGARTFWQPIVDAATPAVVDIIGSMSDFVLGGDLEGLGEQAAAMIAEGISKASAISRAFGRSFDEGFRMIIYFVEKAWPDIQDTLNSLGASFWNFVTDTVMPLAETVFTSLVGFVAQLIAAYWPVIEAQLLLWGTQFWDWILQVYARAPAILTGVVQTIATFLTDNWPTISAALMEWTVQFWDWVKEAAAAAGTALNALAVAILAWATSGEAQAAMNELGMNLGVMITDYLKLEFESGEGATSALMSLASGLLNVVTSITGSLIILGGQIVAGILAGILQSLGVDLKPATFSELSGILTGIGNDIMTIAGYVGEQIVTGIANALGVSSQVVSDALISMMTAGIAPFLEYLGIASASTLFFGYGENIIQGLIEGIRSLIGGISTVMQEIAGALVESGANLLSGLFGGGEEAAGPTFDTAAIVAGMTTVTEMIAVAQLQFNALVLSVANFTAVTLLLLQEVFLAITTLMIEQLILVLQTGVMPLDLAIVNMYTVTLPTLQAVAIATAAAIISAFIPVQALIDAITASVNALAEAFTGMGQAAIQAGNDIQEGMDDAADAIEELIDIIKEATKEFENMAEAAREAAAAARSAGSSSGAAGGLGFQGGTGPLGFLVPPGFPNDSFPLRVQSGERVLVAPAGRSIEDIAGGAGRVVNNYFNMTVNTQANSSSVISDFGVMQSLLGA